MSINFENIVRCVGYQSGETEFIFNASLKIEQETNGLHLFECSWTSSLEIPCVRAIALQHLLTLGSRSKNLSPVMKLVHDHRSAMKLRLKYEHATNNLVDCRNRTAKTCSCTRHCNKKTNIKKFIPLESSSPQFFWSKTTISSTCPTFMWRPVIGSSCSVFTI